MSKRIVELEEQVESLKGFLVSKMIEYETEIERLEKELELEKRLLQRVLDVKVEK
jgi:hypothetical protein